VPRPARARFSPVSRPLKFESFRYVGDKRTQWFFDLDDPDLDPAIVEELMDSEAFICFSPDTPAEARNRCYRAFD
jgi:hypothetical protein